MKIFNSKQKVKNSQAGDTIIEVVFAFTVFSVLVIGVIAIMNRGTAAIQQSLEISLARQQIDSQAEALRYLNDHYIKNIADTAGTSNVSNLWRRMTKVQPSSSNLLKDQYPEIDPNANNCPSRSVGDFAFNFKTPSAANNYTGLRILSSSDDLQLSGAYPQIYDNKAYGIWINAVKRSSAQHYVDFVIQTCWESTNSPVPMKVSTTVRLYDPSK